MPFMPGVSGNPRGRPRNRGASGKLRAAIEKQAPALVNALVKQALAGDTPAAIALLARLPAPEACGRTGRTPEHPHPRRCA